jgi:membrane protease subunit (stomatin/prohibitin family)
MGFIDFVKQGIREMAIARPDEYKHLVVYKHPDTTIPMKAQLTVEADEIALFFRDGKLVGQLPPGRHTCETSNIPFLNILIDWGTGGNLWIAEAYFVSTREMVGQKFGGKVGKLRDPQSGLAIEVMVNGTFSFKVIDAAKLLIGLVGLQKTSNEEFLSWFKELVLKTIKDDIAELVVKKKWPLLDVTSGAYTEEICAEVINGIRAPIERYGVEVLAIGNFNLAMKEEDEKKLNKLYETSAYVNMAGGNMASYQQLAAGQTMMAAGDAMKDAANTPGGGGGGMMNNPLLAGAGLGVGVAIAGNMMNPGQQAAGGRAQPIGGTPVAGGASGITCGKCNATVAPGKFCAECGAPMAAAGPKFCAGCGTQMAGKFCSGCGQAG